jgi:hypothetical protein
MIVCIQTSPKYFEGKAGEVSEFLEEYEFFPLLCALYHKNNCGDIKSFFKEPFNFYKGEIDDLSSSDCEKDKFKVCALVLCVIFNNRFKEEYLRTENEEIQRIIENTVLNVPQKSIADKITLRMFNDKFRHFPPKIIGQKIV